MRARGGAGRGASQPPSQGPSQGLPEELLAVALALYAKLLEMRREVFPNAWDGRRMHDWESDVFPRVWAEAGEQEEPILAAFREYLQSDWARERQPPGSLDGFFKGKQDWTKFIPGQAEGAARRPAAEGRPSKAPASPRASDGVPVREQRPCQEAGCEDAAESQLEDQWLCYRHVAERMGVQPRRVGT